MFWGIHSLSLDDCAAQRTWLVCAIPLYSVCVYSVSIVSAGFLCFKVMFISIRSLLTHSNHVLIGRPLGLFTGLRNSSRAFLAGVFSSSLITCPRKLSLLLFMVTLQGSLLAKRYRFRFLDSLLLHFMFRIFLRSNRLKTSILWFSFSVSDQCCFYFYTGCLCRCYRH